MCTLSWWAADTERGILFNRDEKRTRAHGEKPRVVSGASGCSILMPRDPDAGGTWVGVNEHGLIVALLNNYPFFQERLQGQRSRGKLVIDLLDQCVTAHDCMSALEQMDVSIYPGFLLFAFGRGDGPIAREWDGKKQSSISLTGEGGLHVLTSSSFRREDCEAFRFDLFAGQCRKRALLKEKHGSFHPDDPSLGPVMVRDDAATDSITEIVVGPNNAHMWFQTVRGNPPILSEAEAHCLALQS
ncbi:MAG: NRDE family protein [Opitutaceae bacterium]